MAVVVKMHPAAPGPDRVLSITSIWNYRKQVQEGNQHEAFIWFTKEQGTEGLAMRGTLEQVAPAGMSDNNHHQVSLQISITDTSPNLPFTVDILRPHKGTGALGPLPKLADKLLDNAHQKVALLDEEEMKYLRTFVAAPTTGLTEQAWREIERDASLAARSRISARMRRDIEQDLASALEGLTQDQQRILRLRAPWLAARFVKQRQAEGNLRCDCCEFDPSLRTEGTAINPRSLMDAHHREPIAEGLRVTRLEDFQLLCPNCHRFLHATIRVQQRNNQPEGVS
jgi:hypothetical protein